MTAKKRKPKYLNILTHIGALIPLGFLAWDFFNATDPIRAMTLRTGKTAIILLLLSLACTPINTIFKFRQVLPLRKPLGLYAFMYASIHFAIFLGLDYGFNFKLIPDALLEKRFALAGLSAGLLLIPLAITSTKGWMKRLGKKWKQLHKLVYVIGILAVVHYLWLVKPGVLSPYPYAAILVVVLLLRVPKIKSLFR